MNINATFFIQLFHFLIGYIILERLLLRPWFKVINAEVKQRHEQEHLLKIAQQQLLRKEQFKEEQWREFQVIFADAMPKISLEPEIISVKDVQPPLRFSIDQNQISAFKKDVEQLLLARLTHE